MISKSKNLFLPSHVAIIMDGNNRWAKKHKLPGVAGHKKGVQRAREAVEFAVKNKLDTLTLFAFSSENWSRTDSEVNLLMELLGSALEEQVPNLIRNKVQLNFIGDLLKFSTKLQKKMSEAERLTACKKNKNLNLVIAASYGGRWDIVEAARKIKELDRQTKVDEDLVSSFTSLSNFSDPDLCIRTGGDYRLSNFLLWHLAYSELYFSDLLWPDFDDKQFKLALKEFSKRNRRFGKESNF